MEKVAQRFNRVANEASARKEAALHTDRRSPDCFADTAESGIHERVPAYITFPRWPRMPSAVDARLVQCVVEITKLTTDYENTARLQRVKVWLTQALRSGEQLDDKVLQAARSVFGPGLKGLLDR